MQISPLLVLPAPPTAVQNARDVSQDEGIFRASFSLLALQKPNLS